MVLEETWEFTMPAVCTHRAETRRGEVGFKLRYFTLVGRQNYDRMPIVRAIRLISPSLVEYLQVNTIAGIQVYQLKFPTDCTTLVRVSCQLHNLDTTL